MKTFLALFLFSLPFSVAISQTQVRVSGQISREHLGPLPGASVVILNTGKGSVTDASGKYRIAGLQPGIYLISVSASGYAALLDTINLQNGDLEWSRQLRPSYSALDEVVVAAEKSEERAQHIPSSITTFNTRQVSEFRLWNINQVSGIVPNLYSANPGDYRNVTSIRGITTTSYEQAVATYVDGVNQFNLDTYIPQLFDVERIEILRGPQGTLYGRNAMGGVINIITRKPQNRTEAYTELSAGNFGQQRYGAAVRVPLIKDKLFFGAGGLYDQRKGYYTNQFTGEDFDRQKQLTGNYYLRYYPTPGFYAVLNVKHQNNRNNGPFALAPDKTSALENPFEVNQNATTTMQDDNFNASLSLHGAPKAFRISSQTAWQSNYRIYRRPIDGDFSPLDAISIVNNYGRDLNRVKVFTQEFRLQSHEGRKLHWTGGAFFFMQDNPTRQGTRFGADAPLLGIPNGNFTLINTNTGRNTGAALYGQVSFPLAGNLELTAGLRYDREHRRLTVGGAFQPDGGPEFPVLEDSTGQDNFSAFSPKLGMSYRLSADQQLYVSFSRGYRAGGLTPLGSDPSQPPLSAFDPEYSNNIELGWKSLLWDQKLRLNAAIFYSFVRNVQVPTLVLPDAITIVQNAGKLDSKGAELELVATPLRGLEVFLNAGFTDASYRSLSIAKDGAMVNFDGNKQIFTPSYTGLLAGQYTLPLDKEARSRVSVRLEWVRLGRQYFDLANSISQEAYGLLNARAGFSTGHAEIFVWARNIGDRKYIAYAYDFGGAHLGNPRSIGATLVLKR